MTDRAEFEWELEEARRRQSSGRPLGELEALRGLAKVGADLRIKGTPWHEGKCPGCGAAVRWVSTAADPDPESPRPCQACLELEEKGGKPRVG